MAEPSKEELATLGVETDVVDERHLARLTFEEVDTLPDEPASDVKIKLPDGTHFRERMGQRDCSGGFNFSITNALLDDAGAVADITPPEVSHEFSISGEAMGRMSEAQITAALTHAREVAAAKHKAYFDGMAKGMALFADRLELAGGRARGK